MNGGTATKQDDARRVLARAMVMLGRARDRDAVLRELEEEIVAALRVVGGDHSLARMLKVGE